VAHSFLIHFSHQHIGYMTESWNCRKV